MSKERYALLIQNREVSRHRSRKTAMAAGDLVPPSKKVHVCDLAPTGKPGDLVPIISGRKKPLHWSEDRVTEIAAPD